MRRFEAQRNRLLLKSSKLGYEVAQKDDKESRLCWVISNIMFVGSVRSCFTNMVQLTMSSIICQTELRMMHSCSTSFMHGLRAGRSCVPADSTRRLGTEAFRG